MARKFKLAEKSCQLGNKFSSTGDGEGEQREDLVKFSLSGLMLTGKELDKILGEGAHERLFKQGKGEATDPAFGDDVNELNLVHRYVDSTVTLTLDDETLTLPQAKIMGVVLQPQIGGMTWMECEIEAPAIEGVDSIRKHTKLKIAAQLAFGTKPVLDKRQKNLPLNEGDEDDGQDEGIAETKPKRGNGRQPAGAH